MILKCKKIRCFFSFSAQKFRNRQNRCFFEFRPHIEIRSVFLTRLRHLLYLFGSMANQRQLEMAVGEGLKGVHFANYAPDLWDGQTNAGVFRAMLGMNIGEAAMPVRKANKEKRSFFKKIKIDKGDKEMTAIIMEINRTMTVSELRWNLKQQLNRFRLNFRAKAVYRYLADKVGIDGLCWPSISTITDECSLSRRTVIRATNDLEEAGLVMLPGGAKAGSLMS